MSAAVDHVKAAIEAFYEAQRRHASKGAQDTEPTGVFNQVVRQAYHGQNPSVPLSGEEWVLYTISMQCDNAARSLAAACAKVVEAIKVVPLSDRDELRSLIDHYGIRLGVSPRVGK